MSVLRSWNSLKSNPVEGLIINVLVRINAFDLNIKNCEFSDLVTET